MAFETNSKDRKTSLHGKRFGLDYENQLVGQHGVRHSHDTITAASTLAGYGLAIVTGGPYAVTLQAPLSVGTEMTIVNNSTEQNTVVRSTAAGACIFYGSTGTDQEGQTITFQGPRSAIQLVGISSDTWMPITSASTATYALSTST